MKSFQKRYCFFHIVGQGIRTDIHSVLTTLLSNLKEIFKSFQGSDRRPDYSEKVKVVLVDYYERISRGKQIEENR